MCLGELTDKSKLTRSHIMIADFNAFVQLTPNDSASEDMYAVSSLLFF